MTYKMFIDDERMPPNDGTEWLICRSFADVGEACFLYGFPSFISFDHDLGEWSENGLQIAHWLIKQDMDYDCMPEGFDFYVHSQNPVGAENIRALIKSYLTFKKEFNQ